MLTTFTNIFVQLNFFLTMTKFILISTWEHIKFYHFFSLVSNLSFYHNYLHFIHRLHNSETKANARKRFYIFLFLIFLKAQHFLFLFFYPPIGLAKLLHYDFVNLFIKNSINLLAWPVFITMAYIIYYFVFFPAVRSNLLLTEIVIHSNNNFFTFSELNKKSKSKESSTVNLRLHIRRKFTFIFNLINIFRNFLFFVSIFSHYNIICRLNKLMTDGDWSFWYLLLCHFLLTASYFLLFYTVLAYTSIISLVASFGFIYLYIFITKLKLTIEYLKNAKLTSRTFSNFHKSIVELLQYLAEYNHCSGRLFTVYLLGNLPCSIYCSSTLAYNLQERKLQFIGYLYLHMYVSIQFFIFFILHYYFIQFSRQLRVASQLVVSLCGRQSIVKRKIRKFKENKKLKENTEIKYFCYSSHLHRMKLEIANFIVAFHRQKIYGVTYDKNSLVTMATFVKFFLLYVKCLLITYKMTINNILF